jgi:hypothetical protein
VENHTAWLAALDKEILAIEDAIERHVDTRGDRFAITIDGTVHKKRGAAGVALVDMLEGMDETSRPIGELAGLAISGRVRYSVADEVREILLKFDGLPINTAYATLTEAQEDPLKLIRQLESRVNTLGALRAKTIANRDGLQSEGERAQAAIGTSFKHADALAEASAKLDAVNAELDAKAVAQERPGDAGGGQDPPAEAVAVSADAASDAIPI